MVIVPSSASAVTAAASTAAAWPPDLLVGAAAAIAAAHGLSAAVGADSAALPRSTLPRPEGFFGRLSTLAAGFGLPAGRLALPLAGLAAALAGWPPGSGGWPRCRSACWRRPIAACAALAFQAVERALADILRSGAALARALVGDVVALLDVPGAVANGVVAVRLDPVLEFVAVELVELVAVEVDLVAVDVLPVDVVEIDLAVEVAVVEAVVAVDIDVVAVPAAAPDAPVVPVDGGAPDRPGHRAGEEGRASDSSSTDRGRDSS